MPNHAHMRPSRWPATAILTLFFTAVAGAAAIGWWYARDSPPHQGPIVMIAVDGLTSAVLDELAAGDGAQETDTPDLAALAADSVVFERAYAHSPLLLPAYASLMAGQLPFEHGVRDEGGFALQPPTNTLAELLRNRDFATGAAVSSALLHPDAGVAQGFAFYDAGHAIDTSEGRVLEWPGEQLEASRDATGTLEAAETWARAQEDQRYFLFIQVDASDAGAAAERVIMFLQDRASYDRATIILIGQRGPGGAGAALNEGALRVPLLVKQPYREGAGQRVADPVQHIDLVPTLLDLVRAPIPRTLRGRSLKPLLTDEDGRIAPQPIYAESLAAYYRLGGAPLFALTVNEWRYVRGASESLERLSIPATDTTGEPGDLDTPDPFAEEAVRIDMAPLAATLDRLLAADVLDAARPVPAAHIDRLARAGYMQGLPQAVSATPVHGVALGPEEQRAALEAHEAAARLAGMGNGPAAIRMLQALVRMHPALASVHYQIAALASRTGNVQQAMAALRAAAALRPDAPEVPARLAMVLLRSGRLDEAALHAAQAVALVFERDPSARAAAHEVASRVALARQDAETALAEAAAVEAAVPNVPMRPFAEAALAEGAGDSEAALRYLEEAAAILQQQGTSLEGVHLRLAGLLAQADRPADAEAAFRQEIQAFPNTVDAYTALARFYYATEREEAGDAALEALLQRVPTRDAYAAAARTWSALGERTQANRVRSEARARFRAAP